MSTRLSLLAAAILLAAPAARAQSALVPSSPSVRDSAVAPAALVAAPTPVAATREAAPADARAEEAFRGARAREAGVAVAAAGSHQNGKVYMIVGGAAFLAGAVIGGDAGTIIMIGGAGVGIYGLYLYLQ